jgi:hypothetical protein
MACPFGARNGHRGRKFSKEEAARRRLLNSNLMIVDQAAINAGLASPASQVRRQAANRPPLLGSPSPIVQHVPMV